MFRSPLAALDGGNARIYAIGAGLLMLAFLSPLGFNEGFEMVSIGRNLAQYGAFANPYKIETGLTAHSSPVYPAILASFFYITRSSFGAWFLAESMQLAA